jgi:hypothetical protein
MTTKGLPPSAAEIAARRIRFEQLAANLQHFMDEQYLDQSALARRIWGEYLNPHTGKMSAKNRDRISTIIRKHSWPTRPTLMKIANALGVTPEHLTGPEPNGDHENPDFALVSVAGHPDKVMLRINKLVLFSTATRIMEMLGQ